MKCCIGHKRTAKLSKCKIRTVQVKDKVTKIKSEIVRLVYLKGLQLLEEEELVPRAFVMYGSIIQKTLRNIST